MRDLGRVVAHIPARAGSKRVKAKNLRLLCGKPLLSYAIDCAKKCSDFSEIYVNSNSEEMLALARSLNVKEYKRTERLASDTATGDEFTADFIENTEVETLVMINPVCPFVNSKDIAAALESFRKSDCDTLITCESSKMQTFCNNLPVNISLDEQLRPTQENPCINILNWAVTIWDARQFLKHFYETGSAYIGKKRILYPIDPIQGLKISDEADFKMAECIMYGIEYSAKFGSEIEYWSPVGVNGE